jgi:hypothetical protein
MFDFGAFRKGYVQAEERHENKRAKNAQLYNDFVRNNPDATLEQREKYASDLAGGSEYFRSILPTQETMRTNVDRRQKELAEAERQKKQRAMLDQMTIMTKGAELLAPYYVSGNADEGMSFLTEQFGGMITDQMAPYIQNVAKKNAQIEIDRILGDRITTWQLAGANPNDVESLFEGFDESMTSTARYKANGIVTAKRTDAATQFENTLKSAANAGDEDLYNNVIEKSEQNNPFLTPEDKQAIIANNQSLLSERLADKKKLENQKIVDIMSLAEKAMADNQIVSEEEVTKFVENLYKKNGIEQEVDAEQVAKIIAGNQQLRVRLMDEAETKNIQQMQNKNENQRNLSMDVDDQKIINNAFDSASSTVVKADAEEKENKAAKAAYEAALRKAVGEAVTNYGVNVNDPNVAAALIDAIDRNKNVSGFKGSNVVDPRDVARAVHEVLSTPTLGDSLQGLESASYITTLKSFGVATLEEVPQERRTEFRNTWKNNRQSMYTEMFDSVDPSIANLNKLGETMQSEVARIEKELDKIFEGKNSIISQNGNIMNIPMDEMLGDPTILDHYNARISVFNEIYELNQALARLEATEKSYLQPVAKGGFVSADTINSGEVAKVEEQIKKIKKLREKIRTEGNVLTESYNDIQARLQGATSNAYDGNVGGGNTDELIDYVATSIGLSLASMSPEQASEVVRAEAEKIHNSQLRRRQKHRGNLPSVEEIEIQIRTQLNLPVETVQENTTTRQRRRSDR